MNYGLFFSHLAHLFAACDQHQLTMGSDEELALRQLVHASAFSAICTHNVYTTRAAERRSGDPSTHALAHAALRTGQCTMRCLATEA